ncbi:RNA-binding protein [Ornithinibacillus halophilus]|uniref:Uncharacterized protein n=1 Tax=Ornithinibacillus halophilus TaxID=930117 RepID=A0A1M5IGN3_9BACI|nr:hypothetical protein [Ornithinibacillus halophilus]SHG27441.1 hypothetical protein SAMN05216225_10246 [Ornithinibacillus halophilus]
MRVGLYVLGVLAVIVAVSFIETDAVEKDEANYIVYEDEVPTSVNQPTASTDIPTFSSLESVLEETKEVDGNYVEVYREYEIYRDENDVIIKREPTSNYNYLRYQLNDE